MSAARAGLALLAALVFGTPAAACSISTQGVNFGAYDPRSGSAVHGVGSVSLSCHRTVLSPVVAISQGNSGNFSTRHLRNGPHALAYNLFTSSARIIVWGDGTGGSGVVTGAVGTASGNIRTFELTIHGTISAGQNVAAGIYGDTLVVTVSF